MTDYKYIGEQLKEHFSSIGITQSEIAAKLGVSQQAVGAYLNGQPFGKRSPKNGATYSEYNIVGC